MWRGLVGGDSSGGKDEEPDDKDFQECLKEARECDLSDMERSKCVSQGKDMKGNHVIIMIPSLGLSRNERPELLFRRMLLLFLLKTHEIVGSNYSVFYDSSTSIDLINQYPLIYKFYSILPRAYKKNLQKMYIVHPNIGMKMFFEFARVFLSHKFYNKLCLLETILDFQRIINPTQLLLPIKFLRKEDEERELKYNGTFPSLELAYDPFVGTIHCMHVCAEFLLANQGLSSPGIFRVPGDDGEIKLAQVRLQYAYQAPDYESLIALSENKKYIMIGDLSTLFPVAASSSSTASASASATSSATNSLNTKKLPPNSLESVGKKSSTASLEFTSRPQDEALSIVLLQSINTVAEILKLSIRELPEPLIPEELTRDLLNMTRGYGQASLDREWELTVSKRLTALPLPNLSTLVYIVRFLRMAATESAQSNMDSSNLAMLFAPNIFRLEMTDLFTATVDVKLSQTVLRELLLRPKIIQNTVRVFREEYLANSENRAAAEAELLQNPVISSIEIRKELSLYGDMTSSQKAGMAAISTGLSPAMMSRMYQNPRVARSVQLDQERDDERISPINRPLPSLEDRIVAFSLDEEFDTMQQDTSRQRQERTEQDEHTAEEDLPGYGMKPRKREFSVIPETDREAFVVLEDLSTEELLRNLTLQSTSPTSAEPPRRNNRTNDLNEK